MNMTVFGSLLLLLCVEQFTTLNVRYPEFLKRSAYEDYKYLKDGGSSKEYELIFISEPYAAFVTYDAENNFFFSAYPPYTKIDASGNIREKVDYQDGQVHYPFTPYLFDDKGVYDFSKSEVEREPFADMINGDKGMSDKTAEAKFNELYDKAEVVLYGDPGTFSSNFSYLKIDDVWIRFVLTSFIDLDNDYYSGLNSSDYPAKFQPMVPLAARKGTFLSNGEPDGKIPNGVKNQTVLNYPRKPKIKTLFFQKRHLVDNYAYTPIPAEFYGMGFYRITLPEGEIRFKEPGLKYSIHLKFDSYLYWYQLPSDYTLASDITFLELRYPHNYKDSGSNGLYLIRRK